jgi:tripartite-type tricarboxylate transporter receptor subunit TctC
MNERRAFTRVLAVAAFFAATLIVAGPAQAAWPERPVTLIVPWGAGGGTDATARIIGSLLEKELGQPVTVVNRTGGSGVVGHAAIASAPPDGYTIGLITVEIGMMHWQGSPTSRASRTRRSASSTSIPPGLQVRADAPYKNANELVAAIKANPGKFKASGTGQGGIWHLALAGMLKDLKVDPRPRRGCRRTAPRPACRTSSPAASRSSRARCRKRAR